MTRSAKFAVMTFAASGLCLLGNNHAAADATPKDREVARQLEEYANKLAESDRFSGAILFAKDGKPLFQKAYGLASKAFNAPNRIDTKFNLGSMNKMFTAVAIAQLAQQGKLDFSDPLIKHLPDYPNKEVAQKVTLHCHAAPLVDAYFRHRRLLQRQIPAGVRGRICRSLRQSLGPSATFHPLSAPIAFVPPN